MPKFRAIQIFHLSLYASSTMSLCTLILTRMRFMLE
uniref:Uncharacterized protein n=1 Tax=Arundo donax TaxID=35708 RepID=A0A0A9GV99_ARUDO